MYNESISYNEYVPWLLGINNPGRVERPLKSIVQ